MQADLVTERIKRDVLVMPAEDDDRRLRQRVQARDRARGARGDGIVDERNAVELADALHAVRHAGEGVRDLNARRIADQPVSLNKATKEQLLSLPGIGESKANAIVAYRTEHGSFQKIEDIMNISGIKNGVFDKIKDKITI